MTEPTELVSRGPGLLAPRRAGRRGARARARGRRRRGRRPRLRRPVLAADRAPRARVRRVLRAAAAPRRRRGGPPAQPEGPDPLRRPGLGVRAGRAAAGPGAARARDPRARHLLRHAGAGAHARRPGRGRRGRRVRPLAADGRRARAGCWPARRPSSRAGCRTATRSTSRRRLHRAGELDRVAGRGARGRRARPLRHPVPPRGRPHALRPAGADDVPRGDLRLRAHVEPGVDHRRAGRRDPRPGRRRPRDLRALRRRGLERRRAARAPRDRRPADVRVRRPRADAQERGRAGDLRLPRPLQGPARRRRRRGPLPASGCPG